jgi:hypothetical protein
MHIPLHTITKMVVCISATLPITTNLI